ncbi:MAG: protein kinase [Phycisphaerales bacterium]
MTEAPRVRVTRTDAGILLESSGLGLVPGQRIDDYRIVRYIAEGGFGLVYRAIQLHPVRRDVAIKVVKGGVDRAQVLARFSAERQALAVLNHPGIATVHDAGELVDGRPYFVMEYVPGRPLTEFADRYRLTLPARVTLFLRLTDAIAYAHHAGIVHRDLTPRNVLVSVRRRQPVLKVIDFGIAKSMHGPLAEFTLFTQMGTVIGTPEYMSPEQANPGLAEIDERSDIYSLGVLLYELLAGVTPFDRQDLLARGLAGMARTLAEEPAPRASERVSTLESNRRIMIARDRRLEPLEHARALRADMDDILLKAMEKRPADRFRNVGELEAALRQVLRGSRPRVRVRPRNPVELARLYPGATIAAAGLFIAAIVCVAVVVHRTGGVRVEIPSRDSAGDYRLRARLAELVSAHRAWVGPISDARGSIVEAIDDPEFRSAVQGFIAAGYVDPFRIIGRARGPAGQQVASTDPTRDELERFRQSPEAWEQMERSLAAVENLRGQLEECTALRRAREVQQTLVRSGCPRVAASVGEIIDRFRRVFDRSAGEQASSLAESCRELARAALDGMALSRAIISAQDIAPAAARLAGQPGTEAQIVTAILAGIDHAGGDVSTAACGRTEKAARVAQDFAGLMERLRERADDLDACARWADALEKEELTRFAGAVRRAVDLDRAHYQAHLSQWGRPGSAQGTVSDAGLSSSALFWRLTELRDGCRRIEQAAARLRAEHPSDPVLSQSPDIIKAAFARVEAGGHDPLEPFLRCLHAASDVCSRIAQLLERGGPRLLSAMQARALSSSDSSLASLERWAAEAHSALENR